MRYQTETESQAKQGILSVMQLRTFGKLELSFSSFSRPKPLLLLTYLSLEGVKDRRDLADLFYMDTANPMASLRVALKQIREGAPEALEFDDSKVALVFESDASELLNASLQHDYQRVVELYQGVFLEGFSVKDLALELEEWIYATREYLLGQVRVAYLQLAEEAAQQTDFLKASQLAEQAYSLKSSEALEPEMLKRIYGLLLLGDSSLLADVRKEAAEFQLELDSATVIKAQFQQDAAVEKEVQHNLPKQTTSFVGRDVELLEIAKLLSSEARVITLLGLGGVGKTRLSLQAAYEQIQEKQFQAIYFVPLESSFDRSSLVAALAEAVGLPFSAKTESLDALLGFFGAKKLLLLLDNFEQLVLCADLLSELCLACPNIKMLVSSRERLGIREEWLVDVRGLFTPDYASVTNLLDLQAQEAVALFVQRAKRALLQFDLNDDNVAAVIEICKHVQGSPLGIELAAAWVKLIPVQEIAAELQKNLDLLVSNDRFQNERHRSIRAMFEASWAKLSTAEQTLLRKLSVFQSGFMRDAANEVAAASIPLVMSLVSKSMLRVDKQGRYDRHPLVFRYANEKLQENPSELLDLRAKHAAYYAKLAAQLESDAYALQAGPALQRLMHEEENLNAALEFALEQNNLKLTAAIFWPIRPFWYYRSDRVTGIERFTTVLAWPEMQEDGLSQVQLKLGAASALLDAGDLDNAEALFSYGWRTSEQLGDSMLQMTSLTYLVDIAVWHCDVKQAENYQAKRNALLAPEELELAEVRTKARFDYLKGHYAQAEASYEVSLVQARQTKSAWMLSDALISLANIYREQGKYQQANPLYEESVAVLKTVSAQTRMAVPLSQFGLAKLYEGDLRSAKEKILQSLALFQKQAALLDVGLCELHVADIALLQANPAEALGLLQKCSLTFKPLKAKAALIDLLASYAHYFVLTENHELALQLLFSLEKTYADLNLGKSMYKEKLIASLKKQAQANSTQANKQEPLRLTKAIDLAFATSAKAPQLSQTPKLN